jgi:hypothetical protein
VGQEEEQLPAVQDQDRAGRGCRGHGVADAELQRGDG